MQTHWSLADLTQQYPELATVGSVFRCTRAASGHGRYIKVSGSRRLFADVTVRIEPYETLVLHLHHTWPSHLPEQEREALDEALFRGLMDAICHPGHQLYGCRVATETATYENGETIPLAVTIAAHMAVFDVVKQGNWDGEPHAPAHA
jgi:hypothetical protein